MQFPAVDLELNILRSECTPDSLIFYLRLRNLSQNPIGQHCVNLSCYPINPYQPGQPPQFNPLETNCIPIPAGSGLDDTIRLASLIPPGVKQMYFFINDAGKGAGPSNYPLTGIIECNYANNSDYVLLDLAPRSLDLGPDLVKCASAVTTLNAGAGFTSYLWSDGSQDSIYSAGGAGLHFVEAQDHCGRIYRDSVLISIDPVGGFDLGPDVSICPGGALHFDIAGTYDQVQWIPAAQVSCANCPGVSVQTDTSFVLIAVAGTGNCYTADTVQIQVTPSFLTKKTAQTCQITQVGTDTVLLKTALGCDSLIVTTTTLLPSFLTEKTAQTCQLAQVGSDTLFLKTAFGCDSLVVTATTLSPSLLTEKITQTCQLTEVGSDTLFLKTAFGCDSLVVTATTLWPLVGVDLGLPPAPLQPGSAYAIPLTLSQQGQFDYAWSPPDGLSCLACPNPVARPVQTTTYRLLLTDANGCTVSDSLTLRVKTAEGIYVPIVLAPNGSMHNQRFTVYAAAGTVERVGWLRVYDRWGGLVFERRELIPNDESAGWDGTWRGQRVQPGVVFDAPKVIGGGYGRRSARPGRNNYIHSEATWLNSNVKKVF